MLTPGDENKCAAREFAFNGAICRQIVGMGIRTEFHWRVKGYDPGVQVRSVLLSPLLLRGGFLFLHRWVEDPCRSDSLISYVHVHRIRISKSIRSPLSGGQTYKVAFSIRLHRMMFCLTWFHNCFSSSRDMREANQVGADKYFRARGNYEAARRGEGGRAAAALFRWGLRTFVFTASAPKPKINHNIQAVFYCLLMMIGQLRELLMQRNVVSVNEKKNNIQYV